MIATTPRRRAVPECDAKDFLGALRIDADDAVRLAIGADDFVADLQIAHVCEAVRGENLGIQRLSLSDALCPVQHHASGHVRLAPFDLFQKAHGFLLVCW